MQSSSSTFLFILFFLLTGSFIQSRGPLNILPSHSLRSDAGRQLHSVPDNDYHLGIQESPGTGTTSFLTPGTCRITSPLKPCPTGFSPLRLSAQPARHQGTTVRHTPLLLSMFTTRQVPLRV